MTNTREHQSLSKMELLVLARLSTLKEANEDKLAAAVAEVASPEGPRSARDHVVEALIALRGRSLVTTPPPKNPKKPTKPTKPKPATRLQWTATDGGIQALTAALDLKKTTRWIALKKHLVPMFTLPCDPRSLSNLELLVLARVSSSKGANEDEIADAIIELAPPDGPRSPREVAREALERLRNSALVTTASVTKRTQNPRSKLTDEGARVLREGFGCDTTPTWTTVRDRCIPATALGIPDKSESTGSLGNTDVLVLAALRQHFLLPSAPTLSALCDALISKELGLSGELTLRRIQAHFLARALGMGQKIESADTPEELATRAAIRAVEPASEGTRTLRQVLGRRWAYRVVSVAPVERSARPPSKPPVAKSPNQSPPTPPVAVSADRLLDLVREAIPRIGSNGRFGPEKVFVSALWRYIEDDGRVPDWSLERFKGWLVTANRDQLIDLARADSRGEMDDHLVEQSEINDRGATFHFVVDRRVAVLGRGAHAR